MVHDYLVNQLQISLTKEINSYIRLNSKNHKENNDADEIITYNEIAMLSLLKSALIRGKDSDSVWGIQEYQVYNDRNEFSGRGDLFMMFREAEFDCDILFEAKRVGAYKQPGKPYNEIAWGKELKEALDQGKDYFKAEERFFTEPSFVVTAFFETLEKNLKTDYDKIEMPNLCNNPYEYKLYVEFERSSKVLCVYGHIEQTL